MSHPLDGARAKVQRAKEQIKDFDGVLTAFINDPNSIVSEKNDGETVVSIRITQAITLRWSVIAGEIAHNLRSALDHVAWRLTNGTGGDWTYFPVYDQREKYESSAKGKLKGISAAARAVIESLQPYNRGDQFSQDPLYRLHHLNSLDKHRSLHFVGVRLGPMSISIGLAPGSRSGHLEHFSYTASPYSFPMENGTEAFRTRTSGNTGMQVEHEFAFHVAFEESVISKREPVIPALTQLGDFTEQTVGLFDQFF